MADVATAVPIVALDFPESADALALVDELGDLCRFYKVGLELFTAEGAGVVRDIRARGAEVFLDLKLHDIPNTVRSAARVAARHGARLLTVHASGGTEMVSAAVEGAGPGCGVLAVTVLTSHDAHSLGRAWGRQDMNVRSEVVRLAALAHGAGAHGVVCGGEEAADVRTLFGGTLRPLVPGIRFAGGETHDQARVATPRGAAEAGAAYLVLGRAVTAAPDRRAAMRRVHEEIAPRD